MIRLYNPRPWLSIGMAILLLIITAEFTLSSVSARGNNRWMVKAVSQDTFGSIRGIVIDSISNEPIPFATISFYKDNSRIMTIVSNEKGEFSADVKFLRSKVQLSAIGFQDRTYYLASDYSNLLRLSPAKNSLPNVIVSSQVRKETNAGNIIKKVNNHIMQNYGDFSFDQRFRVYSSTRNYDTTKCEMTDLLDLHFYKDQKTMQVKKWLQDTSSYDSVFFNFIGVPQFLVGSIIPRADILRKGLVIGGKRSKNFDFRLLAHYEDKKYGRVYFVTFKPHGTYNDFFLNGSDLPLGYLKVEMLIREDDYAVVNLKYIWELKVERLNKALEDWYHSRSWKANRVGKIVSNSIVYKYEYSYCKDSHTGRYFVQTIKANCYQTGYQLENHQKVQLYYQYDATCLGIDNVVE